MRRVICDQCRKEEAPDPYGLAPKGWWSVDERGTYTATKDYCSEKCLVHAHGGVPVITEPVQTEAVPA